MTIFIFIHTIFQLYMFNKILILVSAFSNKFRYFVQNLDYPQ